MGLGSIISLSLMLALSPSSPKVNPAEAAFNAFTAPATGIECVVNPDENIVSTAELADPVCVEEDKSTEPEGGQEPKSEKVKVGGVLVNTSQEVNGETSASTASLTMLDYPNNSLWVVAGQKYTEDGTHDFDLGLKHLKGPNLLRVTLDANNYRSPEETTSAGVDLDWHVASNNTVSLSLLGDFSTVEYRPGSRGTDFGIGAKFNFGPQGPHNAMLLYSERGEDNKPSLRVGYIFLDKEKDIAAFTADFTEGENPVVRGYLGFDNQRYWGTYDSETGSSSLITILTFGNKALPTYAKSGFSLSQLINTKRSVRDADGTQFFPASFFLNPAAERSNVLRFNIFYNPETDQAHGLLNNALLFGNNIVLTQNATVNPDGDASYGMGVGYKLPRVTPIVNLQIGDAKRIEVKFSATF